MADTTNTGTSTSSNTAASQAGSDTGQTQANAGASGRTSGVDSGTAVDVVDIGQDKAYTTNLKKLVADELDHAANLRNAEMRRNRNAEDFDQQLRSIAMRSLSDSVDLANRIKTNSVSFDRAEQTTTEQEHTRTVREGDTAGVDIQALITELITALANANSTTKTTTGA